jgi:methionyl aminopeptidase
MSITQTDELIALQKAADAVAYTLKQMCSYAQAGMSTLELDMYGGKLLSAAGAVSAPKLVYQFPGFTCISVNNEFCHGIPSSKTILREGDLINIDVSAELNGFFSDNGCSFIIGEDIYGHQPLIDASKRILLLAIQQIRSGVRLSHVGRIMETEAKRSGFKVVKNLTGHGIGKSLHEKPDAIANYPDVFNPDRFKKNGVVAIETFISTTSSFAETLKDGWTMVGNRGGYMAQHEHTIVVTDHQPIVLTHENGIWDTPMHQLLQTT